MRRTYVAAGLLLIAGAGPASAESGGFFKNLLSGNGVGDAPSVTAPRAMDPGEAYCPPVTVADSAAAIRAFAGAAGDSGHLRHQLTFGQMSRECAVRADGTVGVKVGVQVRALLGPAGAPGSFEAPLSFAIKYNGTVLTSRSRRVSVSVPAGSAQGLASVVEADLIVPADQAIGYDIEVGLGGSAPHKAPARVARHRKPAADEAKAAGDAPPAAQ